MYLRHPAFSRLPFADIIEADLLFASAACCWSVSPSCARLGIPELDRSGASR